MKSAVYLSGDKFVEKEFEKENEFEELVKDNFKTFFGAKTIYFDIKNKIDTKTLGSSIPDGFLFDFKDKENPEFYLVEVELAKHHFYNHIFPQITKFFAFFKNSASRNRLIEKLFHVIKSNPLLEKEFRSYLGKKEIYKALKDIIENSQNILIVINEDKPEFEEVTNIYTDTWDKIVKKIILKQYIATNKSVFVLNPDFENIDLIEPVFREEDREKYDEGFHKEGVDNEVISIYETIKKEIFNIDQNIKINPQKYYISLRKNKNFAFVKFKKKKLKIVIMIPFDEGVKLIRKHKLIKLSQGVQNFYNGPCFEVMIEKKDDLKEIIKALKAAYILQNK